jgi:hypothetical protein
VLPGYRHPRSELVHMNHPLCRFAISDLQKNKTQHGATFSLTICPGVLPEGEYLFLLAFLHIPTFRPSNKMVLVLVTKDNGTLFADTELTTRVLLEILENGRDFGSSPMSHEELARLKEKLLGGLGELKNELEARERKLDQARREQQFASQAAGFEFRLTRARERLERLVSSGAQDFAIRMARFQLTKAEKERDSFGQSRPTSEWAGIEPEEIAVGLLHVRESL